MMHGPEKSDPGRVAKKPANEAGRPGEERVERRAGTKGNADQRTTRRTQGRERVHEALARVRSSTAKEAGTVHRALPPHRDRGSGSGVLRAQARRGAGRGSTCVEGLRGRPRAQARGPARTGPTRSVPGVAEPAGLYPEAGRTKASACGRRAGGQDRPTGGGRTAECDLRGRLPRVLIRVPTGARSA